jgi:CubicO group peptidase (beta-lactamase class C family)
MHRSARLQLGVVALAVAGASSLGGCSPLQPVRAASSYTSHTICSETFISGLAPAQVYAETVATTPLYGLIDWLVSYHVDPIKREVSTTVAGGFASRAVYRDGLGCILVHQAALSDTPLPNDLLGGVPVAPPSLPEIAEPDAVTPADPALQAAVDRALAEPSRFPERLTKAVVVVRDGRVIAERYAPGYGIDTPQLSFSMAKTVISALIGILVRDGRLVVDQPAPVAAWRDPRDPRHGITIDNLLRHNSGLALDDTGPFDTTTRMLMLEDDTAEYADAAPLLASPGKRWHYSSGGYGILSRIVRDAVGGNAEAVLRFARRELFDPLGMRSVTLEFDAAGTPLGSSFMFASARDWARLGMLYLGDGVVGGRRILPEGWVRYSCRPTPGAFFGYAAGLWTSLEPNGAADGRVGTGMPGAFFANGRLGQFILIVPSERLVVVRLGITQAPPLGDDGGIPRLLADVIAALHSRGHAARVM